MSLTVRHTTTLLVLAVTLLVTGCTMQTKPPTNVTASSAVLNAQVGCRSAPYGPVCWELR
jgi:outer membrane biogenesis lipoprotein LolB